MLYQLFIIKFEQKISKIKLTAYENKCQTIGTEG